MNIVARATGLILRPEQEWRVIAAEPAETGSLLTDYAVPVAAIPAAASFIGMALFAGMLGNAFGVRIGPFSLLLHTIAGYVLSLVGVWVWGRIIAMLAPRFGGVGDETAAMKLAVYSPTASWAAGIFAIIPPLAILSILGLYSLYIFYKGVPIVARVPQDRTLAFTVATIACGLAVYILVALVASLFL